MTQTAGPMDEIKFQQFLAQTLVVQVQVFFFLFLIFTFTQLYFSCDLVAVDGNET